MMAYAGGIGAIRGPWCSTCGFECVWLWLLIVCDGDGDDGAVVVIGIGASGSWVGPDDFLAMVRFMLMSERYDNWRLIDVSVSDWLYPWWPVRSDFCVNIAWLGGYQGDSGVPWCDDTSLGIVGGLVGGSWIKRGACGSGESISVVMVFPIDPIQLRSNKQNGVSAGDLGMMVAGDAEVTSRFRGAREQEKP